MDDPSGRTLQKKRVFVVRVESVGGRIVLVVHSRRHAAVGSYDSARQRRRAGRELERTDGVERAHSDGIVGYALGGAGHLHQVFFGVELEPALEREIRLRAAPYHAEVVSYLRRRELRRPCRHPVDSHSVRGRFRRATVGRSPGADRKREVVRQRGDGELLRRRRHIQRVRVHLCRARAVRLRRAERKGDVRPFSRLERNAGEVRPRLCKTRLGRDDKHRLRGGSA